MVAPCSGFLLADPTWIGPPGATTFLSRCPGTFNYERGQPLLASGPEQPGSLYMTRVIIKSLVLGFVIGTVFLGIAPLGLGIAFVEFLRPILIPGLVLIRPLYQSGSGLLPWILGFILNGLIYTALFLSILLVQKHVVQRRVRVVMILFVSLVFLAITGMLTNLYFFFTSPNKSWILRIGA